MDGQPVVSREEYLAILRSDFLSFARKCFQELLPGERFLDNWHQEAMAYMLEGSRLGYMTRLIISVPPRYMKSIMVSVAHVAFLMGHEPKQRIIVASYSSDLAIKLSNDFRKIVTSKWYRELFPNMQISPRKNTEMEVTTTSGGFRLATSVGGVLTGRGANVIIVDDAMKAVDAYSEARRRAVYEWFSGALITRLDDKRNGCIIVVGQRLHLDDLTGNLLLSGAKWHHLMLPAIAPEESKILLGTRVYHRKAGEVLHAEREPLHQLEELRKEMGTDAFEAQYQQSPVPPGGGMIKRKWVLRYDEVPPRCDSSTITFSVDTASKDGGQNDWSVCTVWQREGKKFYLIDVVRQRLNYPALKAVVIRMAHQYEPDLILVEDTGVGTALVAELIEELLFARAVTPERDKFSRMSAQSIAFEGGQVYLPKQAAWLNEYEAELFSFPGSRHDDQIDSTSQALAHLRHRGYDSSLDWVG